MSNDNLQFIGFKVAKYEETNDFGKNQENRAIDRGHLNHMKGQWLTSAELIPPITVNVVTNNIIDGQHRLEAYRELIKSNGISKDTTIKVMYVSVPVELEKQAIVDANTHSKNWSLDDYIHSYVKAGIESYCKLEDWCKTHTLCYNYVKNKETKEQNKEFKYRYAAAMLTGKRCTNELKSASFTFTDDEAKIAENVHTEMLEIIDLIKNKKQGAWIEALAVSWHQYRNMHPFKVWLRELKSKKNRILRMPSDNSGEWDLIFGMVHGAIDKKNECTVAA